MRRPLALLLFLLSPACTSESDAVSSGDGASSQAGSSASSKGGSTSSGGNAQGGQAQGGSAQGGSVQGGSAQGGSAQGGQGGEAEGGQAQGGQGQGGQGQGGNAQGGNAQGGNAQGGNAQGGNAQGGTAQGGEAGAPQGGQGGAASGGAGQATIRVHYPLAGGHALSIRGAGGGLSWDAGLAMTDEGGGVYAYSVSISEPLQFKPLHDDETWARGPNYVVGPGSTVDVYPHFFTTQGKVELFREGFVSQHLAAPRDVWVYLPPTYLENSAVTLPVVYMHDGQNLFDPAMAFGGNEWQVDEAFDAAAETGEIAEAVVVGVGNTSARIDEYTPSYDDTEMMGGEGDSYMALLIDELKPLVDGELRVHKSASQTALIGSSLGGLISSYIGVQRPDVFGLVGAMSPSTWWDATMLLGVVATIPDKPQRALRVYVDSGTGGQSMDDAANTAKLAQQYQQVGYSPGTDLLYVVQEGAVHSEVYWAMRLPGALGFLLGPRPDSVLGTP